MTAGAAGEGVATRWRRRLVVIPAYLLALAAVVALLPLLLPLAVACDLVRDRRLPATRLLAFALAYLAAEALGLLVSLVLGFAALGNAERMRRSHDMLQRRWACALFGAAHRIFGLRTRVHGDDAVRHGPFFLFPRHASLADVLLPVVTVAEPHRIRLRWVLKRELLWDPCLDVVGHRLPNVFVSRGSGDAAREIAAIAALAAGLGSDEGVLIYPEGTRATAAKRERARAALAARDPERAARLAGLRHLLPPRSGGPLALLEAQPAVDVVFMAHAGLDGAATLGDVWRGALIGRIVEVAFRRVAADTIPRAPAERLRWLDAQWLGMDAWVDGRCPETG